MDLSTSERLLWEPLWPRACLVFDLDAVWDRVGHCEIEERIIRRLGYDTNTVRHVRISATADEVGACDFSPRDWRLIKRRYTPGPIQHVNPLRAVTRDWRV